MRCRLRFRRVEDHVSGNDPAGGVRVPAEDKCGLGLQGLDKSARTGLGSPRGFDPWLLSDVSRRSVSSLRRRAP